ncbi:MAG: FAD-dependent oxidoreductase [Phascolarctobacterium sp.]|nr:FAD-dependent oxidoreductase [Phascolarctobacterium sp.]MDO5473492.1 NAD(P)-binding protein [Phascolarctobacterium sp.]
MSRLKVETPDQAQLTVERLYKDLERHIIASPPGLCPVDLQLSFLKVCHAQTCGKCTPCRIGLGQLQKLMESVLEGKATMKTLQLIEDTANNIMDSADCAIGYEAAHMVLAGLVGFKEDYIHHIKTGKCNSTVNHSVPCVALCPAQVDIPGYIALVGEGRYADAIKLIRKDNPFPTACALICEHPCEARCRRNMIDAAINIRGLKRMAVDNAPANTVPVPEKAETTGKRIAIIGGGPSGLAAAYYLELMGHHAVVFEAKSKLGGMLRYGIPSYRFPRERLDQDIEAILSTGVEVHLNTKIGSGEGEVPFNKLREEYDAVYIAIGAHEDKKVGIEGEDSKGVISAVEMLGSIGEEVMPDFKDKTVVVIGGGNVAMDCTRSAIRLGAKKVTIAYRRRKSDMTALPEEIEGAVAEGAELYELKAPHKIEADENGNVVALWAEPQIIGPIDAWGRARPIRAELPLDRIPCDIIVVAIGQGVELRPFEEAGVKVKRGSIAAMDTGELANANGVFAGGDCVTGPATVIRAIAAGKVAAANIDEYLGYEHEISCDVEIPPADLSDKRPCGRIQMKEKEAGERKNNFEEFECGMTVQEACQEAGRCLRCDKFGLSALKGGRTFKW